MSSKLGVAVGHRGAGHLEPHNTVAAFTRAAQDQALGLEAIETDLFFTKASRCSLAPRCNATAY